MSVYVTSLEAPCNWILCYAEDASHHGWGGVAGVGWDGNNVHATRDTYLMLRA